MPASTSPRAHTSGSSSSSPPRLHLSYTSPPPYLHLSSTSPPPRLHHSSTSPPPLLHLSSTSYPPLLHLSLPPCLTPSEGFVENTKNLTTQHRRGPLRGGRRPRFYTSCSSIVDNGTKASRWAFLYPSLTSLHPPPLLIQHLCGFPNLLAPRVSQAE